MKRSRKLGRSKKRGAAMVEALVVILAFILLDISLLYMHGAYTAKMESMRDARKQVWSNALKACQGGGGGASGSDGSLGSVSGQMSTAKGIAKGQSLTKPLDTSLQTGQASSSKSAAGHDTQHGPFPALTTNSKSTVICNEKQAGISQGDIRMTINSLYGSFL